MSGTAGERTRIQSVPHELYFSIALMIAAAAFTAAAFLTRVDPAAELNSRALPLAMALGILAGSGARIVHLLRRRHGAPAPAPDNATLLLRVMVPMSLAMVAYAGLIPALGYPVSTALAMVAVQWIFGTRRLLLILVMAGVTAAFAHYLFVGLLGIFMPEGVLIELLQEVLGRS